MPVGVDDGDHLVHVRRSRQVLGENEEVSAQHAGGGVKGSQITLQMPQRQQKSKLATTVRCPGVIFLYCVLRLLSTTDLI